MRSPRPTESLPPQTQAEPPPDSILVRIARGLDVQWASWERVVRIGLEELGLHLGAASAQMFLFDPVKDRLQLAGRWEAGGSAAVRAFQDTTGLSRSQALAGRAWLERRVLWDSERSEGGGGKRARRHRSGVAIPLLGGGAVAGVLEFRLDRARPSTPRSMAEIELASHILGEALARARVEESLAEVSGRFFVLILSRTTPGHEATARARRPPTGGYGIAHASPSFCRMTGFSEAELKGRSLRAIMGPKTDRAAMETLQRALERGESVATEFVVYRKDGTHFPLRFDVDPIADGEGGVAHFVIAPPDSLSVKLQIARQADSDPLTGLANRTLLQETLRRAIERSSKNRDFRFALLFIDLDGFKEVNDTLGHVAGDELLVSVARQLEGAVRPGDVVARFGGDEFVILLELVGGVHDAVAVAERIQDCLSAPLHLSESDARVSGSIGVAVSDTGYTEVEEVLRDADAAMYLAKREGGAAYRIFDIGLHEAASATQWIRGALPQCLERGELRLFYQPMIDLASQRIVGFEALLRWDHADRGIVPASEFIRQAEELGLILPIGRWVIGEACRQLRAWRDEIPVEPELTLSVNLSERELLDPTLADSIRRSLVATGAEPGSLRLEIPESFLVRAHAESQSLLRPLVDLGLHLGIGDFGRGHSSLGNLFRHPVDLLKVDRQFIAGFGEWESPRTPDDTRALRSILALAGGLGIEVAAAGVETSGQRRVLEQLAFPYAQGDLFSAPVDASAATALLAAT